MKARKVAWGKSLAIVFALGIAAIPLRAQEEAAKPKEEQTKPPGATSPLGTLATDEDDKDTARPVVIGPVDPYDGSIKALGSGLPLYGTSTAPLRWGNFSIGSFEYIGIHDSFDPVGQPIPPWTNLNIFMTSIVFDKYIKKNRIVLQYLPQLAIFQGQIHGNAGANNNIALGSTFALTPRLSLTLQNAFVQVHNNQLIPQEYLAADAHAGGVVQNNFLNTDGSFIADTASATLQYAISPRTTLTVSPTFRYAHVTAADQAHYIADGQTYQAVITLGHALTQYRKIGIIESYQYVENSQAALPSHSIFNTTGVFYTEQLAKALWMTANIGAEHQTYSQYAGAGQWGFSGGLSLVEDFSRRLGVVVAFTRGLTFNNYVTTRTSDRVDTSLGVHITQRLTWTNSLGYFSELGSDPRTSGKYTATGLSFGMFQHLAPFVNYTYSFQNSNTPQLISGMRRTLSFGIRWMPPRDLPK